MIKVNDITADTELTVFGALDIEDYFTNIVNKDVIWKKLNATTAIQITNDSSFFMTRAFDRGVAVAKIDIVSIDYRRIK